MSASINLSLDHPAHYRICVQGLYEPTWLDLLSGIWVITGRTPARPRMTTLVGQVADQAALMGVLSQLYALGLPLVSVECLAQPDAPRDRSMSSEPRSETFRKE